MKTRDPKFLLLLSLALVLSCSDAGDPPSGPTEPTGAVTVSVDDQAVMEGTAVRFNVTLNKATDSLIIFRYSTSDSTATAPADYLAASAVNDTILPGSTSAVVTVPTIDDGSQEPTEWFKLILTDLSGATFADSVGLATILDNDAALSLSIGDASVTEGEQAVFTVSLSGTSSSSVTFQYATGDSSAASPSDYLALSPTTGTILAGSTSTTVSVSTVDDALAEATEKFKLILSNPSGATFVESVGIGTILDNEQGVALSVSDPAVTEGVQANFIVSLTSTAASNVTFDYFTVDSTATASSDYVAVIPTAGVIPAGSTSVIVGVATIDDGDFELAENFKLVLTNLSGAAFADSVGRATIVDNDGVSFINDVKPILQGSCAILTCHGGSVGRSGLAMGNAEYSTMISATGTNTAIFTGNGLVIIPSHSEQSTLYRKTLETSDPMFPFGSRMPFGLPALSTVQKTKIRDWIDQGARNN